MPGTGSALLARRIGISPLRKPGMFTLSLGLPGRVVPWPAAGLQGTQPWEAVWPWEGRVQREEVLVVRRGR